MERERETGNIEKLGDEASFRRRNKNTTVAKAGKLNALKIKQKKAIRKVFNLKYRDHTNSYFANSHILKLEDLIEHTTLCYMNSGLQVKSPSHIKDLWSVKDNGREGLRSTYTKINHIISPRQWINDLPPNRQARLWNKSELEINAKTNVFKANNKKRILNKYRDLESET